MARPDCAAGEIDFEVDEGLHGNPEPADTMRVIESDRQCDGYLPWKPGLDLAEHFAVRERDRREAFENEVRLANRAFENKVREDDRQWLQSQEQATNRRLVFSLIASALVGILSGVVARGWEPGWWWF